MTRSAARRRAERCGGRRSASLTCPASCAPLPAGARRCTTACRGRQLLRAEQGGAGGAPVSTPPPRRWQVWSAVAARLQSVGEAASGAGGEPPPLVELQLPGFVLELVRRLLDGDADAVQLLATRARGALRRPRRNSTLIVRGRAYGVVGPAAIRARLWVYRFSSLAALLQRGEWWEREPLSSPAIYSRHPRPRSPAAAKASATAGTEQAATEEPPPLPPRALPWVRQRLLQLSTVGAAVTIDGVVHSTAPLLMAAALALYSTLLLLAGVADYGGVNAVAAPALARMGASAAHIGAAIGALDVSSPERCVAAVWKLVATAAVVATTCLLWAVGCSSGTWRAAIVAQLRLPPRQMAALVLLPVLIGWHAWSG